MYKLGIEKVLKELNADRTGLTNVEAEKRLRENGKNELKKEKKQSFFKRFFKQFLNIMVAILLISSVVSVVLSIVTKEYADLFEGFVIFFIGLNTTFPLS